MTDGLVHHSTGCGPCDYSCSYDCHDTKFCAEAAKVGQNCSDYFVAWRRAETAKEAAQEPPACQACGGSGKQPAALSASTKRALQRMAKSGLFGIEADYEQPPSAAQALLDRASAKKAEPKVWRCPTCDAAWTTARPTAGLTTCPNCDKGVKEASVE